MHSYSENGPKKEKKEIRGNIVGPVIYQKFDFTFYLDFTLYLDSSRTVHMQIIPSETG